MHDPRKSQLTGERGHAMFLIIKRIHQDHVNFTRLLDLLDEQIKALEHGKETDYDLVLDIMFYMINYPDITHHPTEERIFDKLLAYDKNASALIHELTIQHKQLSEKGNQLVGLLRNVVDSQAVILREEITELAHGYVKLLRDHMHDEENQILPLASNSFDDTDWDEINMILDDRMADPFFDKKVMAEYKTLYKYITG